MQIKPLNKTKAAKRRAASREYHWWLLAEKPKKKGRLAQLTKWNTRKKSLYSVKPVTTDSE